MRIARPVLLMMAMGVFAPVPATATPLISVDLESSYGTEGAPFSGVDPVAAAASPVFASSDVWNHLGSTGFNVLNPSYSNLVDSDGNPTGAAFSIVGSISAYGVGDTADALLTDYFYWNTPSANSNAIDWSITGLTPSRPHILFVNGGYSGAFSMVVDENADGNLGNDPVNVVSSPEGAGVLYVDVMTDATGKIAGRGTGISGEANWAGFQVVETPDTAFCAPTPVEGCTAAAKGSLKLQDDAAEASKRKMSWKWTNGTAELADFGDPIGSTTNYRLCVYDDGVLAMSPAVAASETCDGDSCWSQSSTSLAYKNKAGNAAGLTGLKLKAGTDKAQVQVKGKGASLVLPFPIADTTSITVQLVTDLITGSNCWESVFTAPAKTNDSAKLKFSDQLP